MVIRADPGLIGEPDARALDGSLRGNGRVLLFLPPPYRLAVLLEPGRPGAALTGLSSPAAAPPT